MAGSIIFAGCARDCAPHLPAVLANCARLAATVDRAFFIFAENDSQDDTKTILADWCRPRENAHILCFDGLHQTLRKRTERIAFLRNRIIEFIKEQHATDFDALCLMDLDQVNVAEIAQDGFDSALEFLFSSDENAGAFAVSDPIYYDIYALRHEHWSREDCWKALRTAPTERRTELFQSIICDLQVPIDKSHAPIPVESAFGGLAIYRLTYALNAMYMGLDADGDETCEHVSFNADIVRHGGKLHIFPRLRNKTPWEHCLNGRAQKTMCFDNGANRFELVAPQSHQLDHYMRNYPLYDRRLTLLLTIFNEMVGDASVLDIGANILDTVALMHLSGVRLTKAISVDASLEFYKYACFNAERNAPHFGCTEVVWGFVGAEEDRGNIAAVNGTGNVKASHQQSRLRSLLEPRRVTFADLAPEGTDLAKTDLDGYDHVVISENIAWLRRWKPMLWVEAQIEDLADISAWSNNLLALAEDFPYVAAFDNFGFCLCAGSMVDKWNVVLELISLGARYRANVTNAGQPRFYYLDILFMPRRLGQVFRTFVERLPELKTGNSEPNIAAVPVREYHAQVG
jgi:hypothetical protein